MEGDDVYRRDSKSILPSLLWGIITLSFFYTLIFLASLWILDLNLIYLLIKVPFILLVFLFINIAFLVGPLFLERAENIDEIKIKNGYLYMKSKTTFKIYSYDELKIVEGRFDIQINDYSINKMNWKSSWQTILRSLEDGGLPVYNANFIRELIGAFFGAEFNYKVRVPKENRDLLDN